MLVLTCKKGEKIIIHDKQGLNIAVTVTASRNGRAALGFEAAKTIEIDRERIYKDKLENGPRDKHKHKQKGKT